jgi:hypothetical protein
MLVDTKENRPQNPSCGTFKEVKIQCSVIELYFLNVTLVCTITFHLHTLYYVY